MPATEGVIQFRLEFEPGPAPLPPSLVELNAWRLIFRQLGLLGQDPARYDGYGFGNLSHRVRPPQEAGNAFVISGTQTGHLPILQPEHYTTVLDCDIPHNRVVATGPIKPSSESLSHGLLYQADPAIEWVMHLHSPDIYGRRQWLGLPTTDSHAHCGTPELAEEVARIRTEHAAVDPGLIVMGGHVDGILIYGSDSCKTGGLAIETLARALQ